MSALLNIRNVRNNDFNSLIALEEETSVSQGYSPLVIRQFMDAIPKLFFVAEVNEKLVGYCVGISSHGNRNGWILSMATANKFRRKGIGEQLLSRVIFELQKAPVTKILLHVSPTNNPAISMYNKFGFEEVDFLPNHFANDQDRLMMQLLFNSNKQSE